MSESVNLPALGESVTEGTVTRWLKKVGDRVEVDEPLLEVSTDKVDTEIPSPVAGVIEAILVAEDETVEVGTALVTIGDGSGSAPRPKLPRPRHPPPSLPHRPRRRQLPRSPLRKHQLPSPRPQPKRQFPSRHRPKHPPRRPRTPAAPEAARRGTAPRRLQPRHAAAQPRRSSRLLPSLPPPQLRCRMPRAT